MNVVIDGDLIKEQYGFNKEETLRAVKLVMGNSKEKFHRTHPSLTVKIRNSYHKIIKDQTLVADGMADNIHSGQQP